MPIPEPDDYDLWEQKQAMKMMRRMLREQRGKFRMVENVPLLDMVCPQCGKPMKECKCHE